MPAPAAPALLGRAPGAPDRSAMCQYGAPAVSPRQPGVHELTPPCSLERTPLNRVGVNYGFFGPNGGLASTLLSHEFTHDLLLVSAEPLSGLMDMPPHWLEGG